MLAVFWWQPEAVSLLSLEGWSAGVTCCCDLLLWGRVWEMEVKSPEI